MNKDAFSGFHPTVNLLYFAAVIGFAMFFLHPVCLTLSFLCASTYSVYLHGKKSLRVGLLYMLPMVIFTAILNPLFNHQGATILGYLPNGNPLTLESAAYGIAAAVMLVTVIAWFSCFNAIMTSDKLIYLFGRVIPALSLILSMALRFVPRFRTQVKVISDAQKGIGRGASSGNILSKAKHGIKILSIMVTWALENAIESADSMKNRGYGLPGRTAFSIFRFNRRDGYAMAYISVCAAAVIAGAAMGAYHFRYFPTIRGQWTGFSTIAVFTAYFALCIFPIIVNLKEDLYSPAIKPLLKNHKIFVARQS
ncbi:MAG: energy-coupling factor transporter transmembrane protein EcfT [Defluviitaleaceae bacterium]|nr:energy-coupling factor transporter transmembrane protein EcfT [Defluviitaleaceae bacterium]